MKWIDIKKQKPHHRQQVLITNGILITTAEADAKFNNDGSIFWDGCNFGGYEWEWDFDERFVTHWMPLPPLPPNKPLKSDGQNCAVFDKCNLKGKAGCNDCAWRKLPAV